MLRFIAGGAGLEYILCTSKIPILASASTGIKALRLFSMMQLLTQTQLCTDRKEIRFYILVGASVTADDLKIYKN